MERVKTTVIIFAAMLLQSCCTTKEATQNEDPNSYLLRGTMSFSALEGGCWQFRADDGITYQVFGEKAASLLKDGQRAEIIVRDLADVRTICMAGKNVELLKIIKLY